jgi:hypothetical protein
MDWKGTGWKRQWPNRYYYISIFLAGLKKTMRKIKISGVPDYIPTQRLPNTSLKRYLYANMFGGVELNL